MNRHFLAIIFASALLGSGVAQAGMGTKVTARYDPFEAARVARVGLPTIILGEAASGLDAEAIHTLLLAPGWLGGAAFEPAVPSTSGARLVVVFNPTDPAAAKRDICRDVAALGLGQPGPRLVIRAAYCIDDEMVTRVTVAERPLDGPDDPRLANLMRRVVEQLFPQNSRSQFDSPGL